LVASERRRDTARTVMLAGSELTAARIAAEVEGLRERLAEGLERPRTEVVYELRYRGQGFELPVAERPCPEPAELAELFAAEHERRYGYRDPEGAIELVTIRVALVEDAPELRPEAARGRLERAARRLRFGDRWLEAEVLRGEPGEGVTAEGPCVFELPEATLVLPPGWDAHGDRLGTIVAERAR
jgi:N-methylhydantoinase A